MAAKPYRLLALVKQDAVVRVQKEPDDTVMTWPHLLTIEFFAAADDQRLPAPHGRLRQRAARRAGERQRHPVVAKAPWYLVGVQELLAYFHPVVAGVMSIAFIVLGAMVVPYVDRGPNGDGGSPRPSDRKLGVVLFSMIMTAGLVVTFLGAFFRGPGLWLDAAVAGPLLRALGTRTKDRWGTDRWVTGSSRAGRSRPR